MDDQTRSDLTVRLAVARQHQSSLRRQMQELAANIDETRKALGNPYFYSGRPADDVESEAGFTGYASHEPAFQLWRESQELERLIADLQRRLDHT